jgi:hypothetical protein
MQLALHMAFMSCVGYNTMALATVCNRFHHPLEAVIVRLEGQQEWQPTGFVGGFEEAFLRVHARPQASCGQAMRLWVLCGRRWGEAHAVPDH